MQFLCPWLHFPAKISCIPACWMRRHERVWTRYRQDEDKKESSVKQPQIIVMHLLHK